MRDCISSACLHETNKNSTTITSIKKASQMRCFFYYKKLHKTPIVAQVQEATGFLYRKFRDLGSKFSNETASAGCLRPSYNRLVLFKISIIIIVRSHVLAPIRNGKLLVYPHDYKYEHQSNHVALELS